jgi:hypothetical protein
MPDAYAPRRGPIRWALVLISISWLGPGCSEECHEGESRCEDGHIVSCVQSDAPGGWYFGSIGGCCGESQCVDAERGVDRVAACSTTGAPDARCGTDGPTCVDDRTLLFCEAGFGHDERRCEACVTDPSAGGFCSLSLEKDPRCAGLDGEAWRCDGDERFRCRHGHAVAREAPFPLCLEPRAGQASCAASSEPDPACAGPANDTERCEANAVVRCRDGILRGEPCGAGTCAEASVDGAVVSAFCDSGAGCPVPP